VKLSELVSKIGGRILTHANKASEVDIQRIYAGDTISEILNAASNTTLLVTNMSHNLLPRIAQLMDVPAICLVNGAVPGSDTLTLAEQRGTILVISPVDLFETCGRLYLCFDGSFKPSP